MGFVCIRGGRAGTKGDRRSGVCVTGPVNAQRQGGSELSSANEALGIVRSLVPGITNMSNFRSTPVATPFGMRLGQIAAEVQTRQGTGLQRGL